MPGTRSLAGPLLLVPPSPSTGGELRERARAAPTARLPRPNQLLQPGSSPSAATPRLQPSAATPTATPLLQPCCCSHAAADLLLHLAAAALLLQPCGCSPTVAGLLPSRRSHRPAAATSPLQLGDLNRAAVALPQPVPQPCTHCPRPTRGGPPDGRDASASLPSPTFPRVSFVCPLPLPRGGC